MTSSYWDDIKKRHEILTQELMASSLDNAKRVTYQKEHSYLSEILEKNSDLEKVAATIVQTRQQAQDAKGARPGRQTVRVLAG